MRMSEETGGCPVEALPTEQTRHADVLTDASLPTRMTANPLPATKPLLLPQPLSLTNNNNKHHKHANSLATDSKTTATKNHVTTAASCLCPAAAAAQTPADSVTSSTESFAHNGDADAWTDGDGSSSSDQELDSRFEFRVPGQHMYRGIMMGVLNPVERMRQLEEFAVREDDIVVSGYPKSGTTWLEEIVYLIQHGGNTALSDSSPNYLRIPYLEGQYLGNMLDSTPSPRIYKTHLPHRLLPTPIRRARTKVVHILRNPRDTAVSYFHFHRTLRELGKFDGSWREFLDMFMCGYVCYGDWFRHTREWWRRRHDANVLIVTYEEMKRAPRDVIVNIARFCGKSLDDAAVDRIIEHTSFESMSGNPMLNFAGAPNIDTSISSFMRKGQVGDWKNHFTVAQSELFKTLEQDKLAEFPDLPYAP